ncbi:hypothetical protein THRCLA_20002 [Thraustotheca clavata]|uniref:Uncharacterized protein n=1 Tax=Thraustotheca clavata TaxID=74557 RepID=A0A1W0ACH2_9STRA|nr:hypothetical protein THRCLA_20002 [Thraustotheca clavata]
MADPAYGFFPSGQEVSSGLKWLKDHPIAATAAAAAATAVSIVTYLRSSESKEDKLQHVVSWCDSNVNEAEKDETTLVNDMQSMQIQDENTEADATQPTDAEQKVALHNASPQWGWYVAITPPRDPLAAHNLSRSMNDAQIRSRPPKNPPPPPSIGNMRRTVSVKML